MRAGKCCQYTPKLMWKVLGKTVECKLAQFAVGRADFAAGRRGFGRQQNAITVMAPVGSPGQSDSHHHRHRLTMAAPVGADGEPLAGPGPSWDLARGCPFLVKARRKVATSLSWFELTWESAAGEKITSGRWRPADVQPPSATGRYVKAPRIQGLS